MITVSILTAMLLVPFAFTPEAAAQSVTLSLDEAGQRLDGMTIDDLIASTAGDVRADKLAKYSGDFSEYWSAARSSLEGKTIEAVAAYTVNGRFRATGNGVRLIPTTLLRQPAHPADLIVVSANGIEIGRVQAKLGAGQVIAALDDPKYEVMDILTTQDTYDELRSRLHKASAKATQRGVPLKPSLRRLERAIDSGRLWSKLPCGAPLPERAFVNAAAKGHFSERWCAAARTPMIAARERVTGARQASKTASEAAGEVANAAGCMDDVAKSVVGSADDVTRTAGQVVADLVGPAAFGIEVVVGGVEAYGTERRFAAGDITQEEREISHGEVFGGAVGGWTGGTEGAAAGAAVGTLIMPGFGTAVGGVVGGIGGGIGGSAAGRYIAARGVKAIHASGATIRSAPGWMGRRAYGAYRWATRW